MVLHNVNCPSQKSAFKTKADIKRFIDIRNTIKGNDGYRSYYCKTCGYFHLTTTVYVEEYINKRFYNRMEKKEQDIKLFRSYGL